MNNLVWALQIPVGTGYAELLSHYQAPVGDVCEQCGALLGQDANKLVVEWEDGSNQIADFVFSIGDLVVRQSVAEELSQLGSGFTAESIEMFDHPNLHRKPSFSQKKLSQRVWLPYEGPPLVRIVVQHFVELSERSTIDVRNRCGDCGTIIYQQPQGVEVHNSAGRHARKPGAGLFIQRDAVGDAVFFSPKFTAIVLCTKRIKDFIECRGYTNVEFLEYGELY